jgi:Xaa-Pro aminopeptidase
MLPTLNISPAEFEARTGRLLDHVRAQKLSGVVLFDNYYLLYYTGFAFIPTERPIAFVMNARGEKAMFVPRLEAEHAKAKIGFARVALIRESAKWANLAHRLLQRYTVVGATETEVSQRASQEATRALMDTLGPLYQSLSMFGDGPSAGYRGQIGRNAAIPHALANNIVFQPGDVLVTGANTPMWGYNSELERTMIIRPVSDEQRQMFAHMQAAQAVAFAALKPGARCSDVDHAVRRYYDANDLMPFWKHHTGHAIGLRYHEGPFLDLGDHTELKPGMVFTVEPGLYAANLGGFRHSDTVLITEEGIELLTYYPRELEALTL